MHQKAVKTVPSLTALCYATIARWKSYSVKVSFTMIRTTFFFLICIICVVSCGKTSHDAAPQSADKAQNTDAITGATATDADLSVTASDASYPQTTNGTQNANAPKTRLDLNTPEGLEAALNKREQLHIAMSRISDMMAEPESLLPYVPALKQLYQDGSSFDREVLQALSTAADAGADVHAEMEKAASTMDYRQLIMAADCAKRTKDVQLQSKLLDGYDKQYNPEVKRAILETGLTIQGDAIAEKAISMLSGNFEETPISLLLASCNVLAYQKSSKSADSLLRAIPYVDVAGRTLAPACTEAFFALDKDVQCAALRNALKYDNKSLKDYVKAHTEMQKGCSNFH